MGKDSHSRESHESHNWLGIIGAGQLAKMLCQAARDLKLHSEPDSEHSSVVKSMVLGTSLQDCARENADLFFMESSADKIQSFKAFLQGGAKHHFAVTFENEFLDYLSLKKAHLELSEKEPFLDLEVFAPKLSLLETLSDKLAQKQILTELGIPTTAYEIYEQKSTDHNELTEWLAGLTKKFPDGFVLKWARFGYDGKGVYLVSPQLFSQTDQIFDFCSRALQAGTRLYAEELVDFAGEVAMVACAGKLNASATTSDESEADFVAYPLVATTQRNGICFTVHSIGSGVIDTDLQLRLQSQATHIMKKFAQELSYVGSFAFEFFLTKKGRLLVNEIAPRVHNSAHYSLDVFPQASQFHNHIRACLGWPLAKIPSSDQSRSFGMVNLLGFGQATLEDSKHPPSNQSIIQGIELLKKRIQNFLKQDSPSGQSWETEVHWYGKWPIQMGRKMGHINFWRSSPQSPHVSGEKTAAQTAQALIHELYDVGNESWKTYFSKS